MQKFLLTRIIIFFIIVFLFNSCKKTEVKSAFFANPQIEAFLKIAANSSGELKIVTTELRQQLYTHNFVNDFIQWHGKPMWDKAIFVKNKSNPELFNGLIPVKSILTNEITAYITCNNLEGKIIFKAFNKGQLADRFEENRRDSLTLKQLMIFPYLENRINGKNFIDLKTGTLTLSTKNVGQTETLTNNPVQIIWICVIYICDYCEGTDPNCPYGGTWQECTPIYTEGGGGEPCTWCPPPPTGGGGCTNCEPPPGECESSKTEWYSLIPPSGPCEGFPNSPTVAYLANTLGLSSARVDWLNNHPNDALIIKQSIEENKIFLIYDDVVTILNDPGALIASKIAIDAAMNNFLYGPYNTAHYNSIRGYIPNSYTNFDPIFWAHFRLHCALIKIEHPEWVALKIYWEASQEIIHLGLDVIGLVPVVGEVADLANGLIYTIQGDGVNAALSYSATLPLAGWASFGIKMAKRSVTTANGSKRTLKWMVQTGNIINFGDRNLLRKVLGLANSDSRIAHHLIPWEKANHRAVQKAAEGYKVTSQGADNAFHLNEALNGIPLNQVVHSGNHAAYLARVQARLDAIPTNFSPQQTRQAIETLINDIKVQIQNNPNTHIDNLIF
ncbi:MAG TPA: AHH domain-containing protein [Ferruginibacter sp.]|nr:AHH domain-containing protein [Ferruginibacter sp.]